MEAMRQSWSDDRLDDLSNRVETGFVELRREMREGYAELRQEMREGNAELRQEMKMGFDQVNARFDAMQQTMIRVGAGLIGVLIASAAGLIATQL
jgi:chromosome segregation ATPase